MKKVDFTKEGGFPLTQFTLEHMQSAYNDELLPAMMAWLTEANLLMGASGQDRVIITGLETKNGMVTPGWLCIEGELLFFEGASENSVKTSGIGTQTILTSATFKDLNNHDVYAHKRAVVGGDDPEPFGNYRRLPNLAALKPIQTFRKRETLPGLPFGTPTTVDISALYAKTGDAVVVNVVPDSMGYLGWFTASGVVVSDGLIRVTIINVYSGMIVPSIEVELIIKVIK